MNGPFLLVDDAVYDDALIGEMLGLDQPTVEAIIDSGKLRYVAVATPGGGVRALCLGRWIRQFFEETGRSNPPKGPAAIS